MAKILRLILLMKLSWMPPCKTMHGCDAGEHPDAVQHGMDVDMLMSLGVEPADAIRFARKCMRHTAAVTFIEAYGRGGLSDEARKSSFTCRMVCGRSTLLAPKTMVNHGTLPKPAIEMKPCGSSMTERPRLDRWVASMHSFLAAQCWLELPQDAQRGSQASVKAGLVHLKFVCQLYRRQIRPWEMVPTRTSRHQHCLGRQSPSAEC